MSLPKNGKNTIVLREGYILPYIESLPQSNVNYIEEDLGVYYIFLEEDDDSVLPSSELEDEMWHMHFDGAYSSEGNGACIILYLEMFLARKLCQGIHSQLIDFNFKFHP
jgi:hypothetical protein